MKLDDVKQVLKEKEIDPKVSSEIIDELIRIQEEAKELREKNTKNQFVILTTGLPPSNKIDECFMSIIQIPEDASPTSVIENIKDGCREYNNTKKGTKNPVKTLGEALEIPPRKYFKNRKINIKTKEPVFIIETPNDLDLETNTITEQY